MKAHATAIVEPGAQIDPSVTIGAFCFVSRDAVLSSGVHLHPHVVIEGKVEIGKETRIGIGAAIQGPAIIGSRTTVFPYAVIGQLGQYPERHNIDGKVEIDSEVTIREFVAINKSVLTVSTKIGRGCYIMARTQVDHDCVLEPFVKTATGVTLGGSVHIEDHAYLGMNAVVHQGLRIGRACMIGMNGVVTAHVPPFTILINRRISRVNTIGLSRIGASQADIEMIKAFYGDLKGRNETEFEMSSWTKAITAFTNRVSPEPVATIDREFGLA
ncbi:hypothetical protein ACLBX9_04035 [Methylobacterium sp. A49B]